MKTSKRNSNFELLRIITMFLIVFHHSIVHGLLVNSTALGQGNPVTPQIWGTVLVGQMVAMLEGCCCYFCYDIGVFSCKL